MVNDTSPRFRIPSRLDSGRQELPPIIHGLASTVPADVRAINVIEDALASARKLAVLLNHEWNAERLTMDLLIPVTAITHQVLSSPRPLHMFERPEDLSPLCVAAELVRVSVLAMLSVVITTTTGDNLYCIVHRRRQAQHLLSNDGLQALVGWPELKLWVLVIQALVEAGSERDRLVGEIVQIMVDMSLRSWDHLKTCLQRVVWVDKAAIPEMDRLQRDLQRHLVLS